MAELPRYRRDGLLSAVSPGFDSAALREGARASETLTRAMDRVSQMAFQVAGEQAKIEGIEYGAANAPTAQQLATAKASGKDLEDLLPGDTFSIFGSAARSTALDIIGLNIEKEARESIVGLQAGFEAGTIDLPTMQEQLVTIEDSYSAILQDISPAATAKFRAAIATVGNSAFLAAAKDTAEAAKKQDEISLRYQADLIVDGVEGQVDSLVRTIFKAGITADEKGGAVILPEDRIETVSRDTIASFARQIDDPTFYKTYTDKLDAEISRAKVDLVAEYLEQDPLNRVPELDQDGAYLADPNVKHLFSILDSGERDKVEARIEAYVDDIQAEADASEVRSGRDRDRRAKELAPLIHKAINNDRLEEARQYMDELQDLDYGLWKTFDATTRGGGAIVDLKEVVQNLDMKDHFGTLKIEEINKAFSDNQITKSTYDDFFKRYQAQKDSRYQDGLNYAKNALGYPEYDFVDPQGSQRLAIIQVKNVQNEWFNKKDTAIKEGRDPGDAFDFFKKRAEEIKNGGFDPAKIENAIKTVNTFIVERGISISDYSELSIPDDLSSKQYGELSAAKDLLIQQGMPYGDQ